MKDPKSFTRLGARAPQGVLLLGKPGVGKTMLAKALAGECNASFISASGSEFTAKYFGVGVGKVKNLFEKARKNAPCIIFIDEIDGVSQRVQNDSPGASEGNRIINQLLIEMDGFDKNEGIIVVAATNLAENLDQALLREGRFDRQITIDMPDVIDRTKILEHYARSVCVQNEDIDYAQLARMTVGFSPATLAHVVNQAALVATRRHAEKVSMQDFLESVEISQIGELNPHQRALTDKERHRIAVHEAGHAIVAAATECGLVEKVTILPRGGALGVTLVTQPQDKMLSLRSDMEKRIQMLLGGRTAEMLVLKEASSGAAQDLSEASKVALNMIGRFGLDGENRLFSLDAIPGQHAGHIIRDSVERANVLLEQMQQATQTCLTEHRKALDRLTQMLLCEEVVDGHAVYALLNDSVPAARAA